MKTNREIRQMVRETMKKGWFGRVSTVALVLYFIAIGVSAFVLGCFSRMGIQTWQDFLRSKVAASQGGLNYTIASLNQGLSMSGAFLFQQLAGSLFGAILLFGLATVLLKAVRNDSRRWFADSFGGFTRPLEVLWLIVLMNLRVVLWSLLLLFPGIIALYRYRAAWYVKSDHPEWTAGACLAESGRLMKGFKMQAFFLDLFFIGLSIVAWILTAVLCLLGGVAYKFLGPLFGGFGASLLGLVIVGFWLYVIVYFLIARAAFYQALSIVACQTAES